MLFRVVDGEKTRVLGKTAFSVEDLRGFADPDVGTAVGDRGCSLALADNTLRLSTAALLGALGFWESCVSLGSWIGGQDTLAEYAAYVGAASVSGCVLVSRSWLRIERRNSDRAMISRVLSLSGDDAAAFSLKELGALDRALERFASGRYRSLPLPPSTVPVSVIYPPQR